MSGCVEQTTARYTRRPSPPFPANQCCGSTMMGNDGLMYESRPNINGVCRWYKIKTATTSFKRATALQAAATLTNGCAEQHTAKYRRRKMPPYDAAQCAGQLREGNDGETYQSQPAATKSGYRWIKVKQTTSAPRTALARSGCVAQTTAKYAKRKSPPLPANECCGRRELGNDGNLYESRPDKNGVCRWYKLKEQEETIADDATISDAARLYGDVVLLTRDTLRLMKPYQPYFALYGQDYTWRNVSADNVETATYFPNANALMLDDEYGIEHLDQGLGYLCTGSGCDPIWLVRRFKRQSLRPDGTDARLF